ncbi:DNA polymerase I [Pikeienuella sp. HZG-20]|uniref:DNA polymerase I n=1 Tax=Paludibacillus litoralis TaxID=3133267 RepID=UPI0030EECADA
MPAKPEDHLYLVDGSGFIFRAYHALPALTRKSDGLPVGAVAGFCNMIHKMLQDLKGDDEPSHVAVIFDASRTSFRNEFYPDYKGHRPDAPEDLRPQFPLIRRATRAFNLPCIEIEGFEADDVIATYAREAAKAGAEVTIVSSDKDLMQLVGDQPGGGYIGMVDLMKNKVIGVAQVHEKFGVGPDRVIDVQALAGDSVDNVPGAPGIGVKTAALLINEYGDLETLLARAEEIKQPKRRASLIENAELIRISKRLVTLDDKVGNLPDFDELARKQPEAEPLLAFLNEMEFTTLTRRIAAAMNLPAPVAAAAAAAPEGGPAEAPGAAASPIDRSAYEIVRDLDTLRAWVASVYERGVVAVDTETTSLDEMQAELVGVSLATAPGRACYIPLGHSTGNGDLLGAAKLAEGQAPLDEALAILKPMLEDSSILKIAQNMKYDMKVLARYGVKVAPFDDTMLLSYAQEAGIGGHGMDALAARHLGHETIPIKTLIGGGKSRITFDRVEIDKAAPYAAEDADVTFRLWRVLKPGLVRHRVTRVYETMERPLVPVLADMERAGVLVDRDALSRLSNTFAQKMAALEAEIHELAGETFNVGSPKQLGEILFERMGLDGGKKGKTGAYATGADVLETLAAEGHDLPARVLDWRQLSKLKGTYTDALQTHINPETGRVHTSYSIAGASTGRLASTDPNLQNIPVRTEEGRRIREAFIAAPGNILISLDYSQIELRLLAHIAGIDALRQAFAEGQDIHAATASEIFGVPIEGMDPMIRRQAKAINFGVIYGISPFGLANNLRIPREDAKRFIDAYFEKFPGIRAYMDATVETAKRQGYVETVFGRRIHTPEINAKGPMGGFQRRAAINAPIQGSAADVIRRAMIRIPAALSAAKLSARMLLQVHDELIFEAPEAEAEKTIAAVKKVMEGANFPAVQLSTPLIVDAGQGPNWAAAH